MLSAQQLALAYRQRWEIENTLDELKTHQRGPRTVLRSKSPELVQQEIWGHLCCHYAIRTLMWDTADHYVTDPDQVSFITALRIMRRSIAQPAGTDTTRARSQLWQAAKDHLIALINPQRRLRVNPHAYSARRTNSAGARQSGQRRDELGSADDGHVGGQAEHKVEEPRNFSGRPVESFAHAALSPNTAKLGGEG